MTQQTALDEFVEDMQERRHIHKEPLFEGCRFVWRFLTAPIEKDEILQDPRYLAYCKEQEDREVVNANMYADLKRMREKLAAQEVLRKELGLGPSPIRIVDEEQDRKEEIKGEVGRERVWDENSQDEAWKKAALELQGFRF